MNANCFLRFRLKISVIPVAETSEYRYLSISIADSRREPGGEKHLLLEYA